MRGIETLRIPFMFAYYFMNHNSVRSFVFDHLKNPSKLFNSCSLTEAFWGLLGPSESHSLLLLLMSGVICVWLFNSM